MNFSLENTGFPSVVSLSEIRPWRRGLALNFHVQRFLQINVCGRHMWGYGRYMWEICSDRSVAFLKGESYLAHLCVWTVGLSFGFLPSSEWITELTVPKTSLWTWPLGWFLFSENSAAYQFSYFQWISSERKM